MKELLIVFDLNGTLLSRIKSSSDRMLVNSSPFPPSAPNLSFKRQRIYVRPHFYHLLKTINENPRFRVGVWTSAQQSNALRLTDFLFRNNNDETLNRKLEFVLDRSVCENAPMGTRSEEVVKNLDIIFNSKEYGSWNLNNTVLIDDSKHKARKQPENLLWIPNFDVSDHTRDSSQDIALLQLATWLTSLESDFQDIREIIKQRPPVYLSI
jgi:hypothetical protein